MKTLTAPIFLTERLLLVLAALVSLFIIFSASTVFAAAVCVTNPEQGLCDIFVTVTPSAYTVSPGEIRMLHLMYREFSNMISWLSSWMSG